jgi:hypothetical protein
MPSQPDDASTTDDDTDHPAGDPDATAERTPSEREESAAPDSTSIGLATAQQEARDAAEALLDHDFEGVIEVSMKDDGGWRTLVEVVERHAVPNTQDIIGRYAIELTETGDVSGYELRERYQRGDVKEEL